MKRLILAALFAVLCLVGNVQGATIPVTGTIHQPDGRLFNGSVRMTLNYPARDFCSSNIVVPQSVTWRIQNGSIQSGAKITANDCIAPSNTVYLAEFFSSAGARVMAAPYYISGQSFDLGSAVPTSLTTSNISFDNFTGIDAISAKDIDNTKMCDAFTGASAAVKINACIAAIPAGGTADATGILGAQTITSVILISKPIKLKFGCGATFTYSKGIYVQADDVTIEGCGPGQTTFIASPGVAWADNDPILVSYGGVYPGPNTAIQHVIIKDLTIDGNQANLTGRPYASDTHGNGINLNRCHQCRVTNTVVKNIVFQGIVSTSANADAYGVEIDHNWVDSFGEMGIGIESVSRMANVHDNMVTNGLSTAETAAGGIGIYAASLESDVGGLNSDDHLIQNNTVYNMPNDGIVLQDGIRRAIVSGNVINTADACISVLFTTDATRVARDVSIIGNTCRNATVTNSAGIFVSGPDSANAFLGMKVEDNTVVDAQGAGIFVQFAVKPLITGNFVRNTGLGMGTRQEGIIVSADATNLVGPFITGNQVTGAAGAALRIADAQLTDSVLSNNYILNNGSTITDAGTRTVIWGNVIDTAQSFNIETAVNPGLTITRASGATGGLTLAQTGVASWNVANTATTGTFTLTQGGSDRLTLDTSSNLSIGPNGNFTIGGSGKLGNGSVAFLSLGTPNDGTQVYCSNCQVTSGADNTCAAGGMGAFAFRVNGAWKCFANQN